VHKGTQRKGELCSNLVLDLGTDHEEQVCSKIQRKEEEARSHVVLLIYDDGRHLGKF
jgi:ribosomal protein S24E